MVELRPGERLDSLQRKGYRIIQNENGFCFGMAAVLLTSFCHIKKGEKVLDMGTGTGVIPILLCAKTEGERFFGLDIQDQCVDMAERSVALNGLSDRISIIKGDIKEASSIFKNSGINVVVSNPPYMPFKAGEINPESAKAISRHEVSCTLRDVLREAGKLLPQGGRFYMVHRPYRLPEIFTLMKEYRLEPKRMRMVHPGKNKEPNMVLIEGVKDGGSFLKVEKPLIIFDDDGSYDQEVASIYG